ncbi:hypothetical protein [Nocardioides rubriscoriae]|uniref:hypothetical protein n=1 Tax=Nocardioides rubriscoriae TaxID=642762 RepID=UPI0011E038E5|nr:hypothetical protein [Nocardioides rubriscoriae]
MSRSLSIDPPLAAAEVEFLASFGTIASRVRRVWPGQPSRRCPWRPSADGRLLQLDEASAAADPASVAGWLRFLSREFLAPSTADALLTALDHGLRGGHRLTEQGVPEREAVVIDLQVHRTGPSSGPSGQTER